MKLKKSPGPDLTRCALFHIALDAGPDGSLPTEFRLFSAGPNKTTKGTFLLDDLACTSIMTKAAELGGTDFMIDYEHASFGFVIADPAEARKAAGWFQPEVRDGALWASKVTWTPKGAQKLRDREFRYISPACDYEETPEKALRLTRLINAALTNMPATIGAPALVAHQDVEEVEPQEVHAMKSLLILLGLAENAAESEAVAAVTALKDGLRSILTLSGKSTTAEAIGVITAWKAGAEQSVELSARLSEIEKAAAARELEATIRDAKAAGKLSPAMETWARSQPLAQLKAYVEVAPVLVPAERREKEPSKDGTVSLSSEELEGCKKLGLDPKTYAEHKAKSTAARS